MNLQDIPMGIGMVAAVLAGIGGVSTFFYAVYKIAKRIEGAIGVDSQGRTMSERMENVEYQLWENSGESLKDKVNEIDRHARETAVEVQFIKDILVQYFGSQGQKTRKTKKTAA